MKTLKTLKTIRSVKTERQDLKSEMDYWVKNFSGKLKEVEDLKTIVDETRMNTDFNYELIKEIKNEVAELKKTMAKLQHCTVIALKSRPLKDLNQN